MKKILIISFSWLDRDPRVKRQIHFLKEGFDITSIGFSDPLVVDVKFHKIGPSKLNIFHKLKIVFLNIFRRYEQAYWSSPRVKSAMKVLDKEKGIDLILANDLNTLPLAALFARRWNARLIVDLHEYAPAEFDANPLWKYIMSPYNDYLCKRYLPYADRIITVCKGIADKYKEDYGIDAKVINNATFYVDKSPLPVKDDEIRIIHHGIAIPERKLENMILLMKLLDKRYKLDLMLMPYNQGYVVKLRRLAASNDSTRIIDPIPSDEIPHYLNQYDIGMFLLPPDHLNYFMALPNKLFEFIQARLCVAIWPSSEMKEIVSKYRCGIVSRSFSLYEMANRLNSLSSHDIYRYKLNSHRAARELCAENNKEILLDMVEELI